VVGCILNLLWLNHGATEGNSEKTSVRTADASVSLHQPPRPKAVYAYIDMIKLYTIIILPVVLYGCETWSHDIKGVWERCWGEYLDRREMKWQDVGENCIMSFITCTLKVSVIISRRMRWEEHLARNETVRYAYKRLIGESEKTYWKTHRRRRGKIILKWNLKWVSVGAIHLTQNRAQWQARSNEPSGSIKHRAFLDWLSDCWPYSMEVIKL
jgi:hypothetical protein